MAFFGEVDAEGIINIPVIGSARRLDIAVSKEGVGIVGQTIKESPQGVPATFRIQLSNEAVRDVLGLLLRYAEEANLEPNVGVGPKRPKMN